MEAFGPLHLGPNGIDIRDDNEDNIVTVPYGENPERAQAYARLFAKAPELLTILKNMLCWGVEFDDSRLKYVTVQVDRWVVEDARVLLDEIDRPCSPPS